MPLVQDTNLAAFESDLAEFCRLGGKVDSLRPFDERADKYAVDYQYILMNRWAMKRLEGIPGPVHDFASKFEFAAYLSLSVPVVHYDIREPDCPVPGLAFKRGDLAALPINDGECQYATCLHVAEHIGLGRYGDKVDPKGFVKACLELTRVLAPGGTLLFAVPTGRPRVVFNAHRVLSAQSVVDAFGGLRLTEFSAITKNGDYVEHAPISYLDQDPYGCGLYRFTKEIHD